jgi:hypothetical protein
MTLDLSSDRAFGLAVARFIANRHPEHTARKLAEDLGRTGVECTIKTAENILSGHLSAKSITRLVQVYGLELLVEAGSSVTGVTLSEHLWKQAEAAAAERDRWGRAHDHYAALAAEATRR